MRGRSYYKTLDDKLLHDQLQFDRAHLQILRQAFAFR